MAGHEHHYSHRRGDLRAAVMGANDGIVSMACLVAGMYSAGANPQSIFLTALTGLFAGAFSMAAGEYVSVSSQAASELADIRREKHELQHNPDKELKELQENYQEKGLDPELAKKVAIQLTEHNALAAHVKEELGHDTDGDAKPWSAAFYSFLAFMIGGILPTLLAKKSDMPSFQILLWSSSGVFLAILGYLSAYLGGAEKLKGIARSVLVGFVAIAVTMILGENFFGRFL